MRKIYFLYGSDYSAIESRINELKEQINSSAALAVKKHLLSNLEEVELFLNKSFNLSLFGDSSLEIIKVNLRVFNQLEKRADEFVDFLQPFSSDKYLIVSLPLEKTDKNTKDKISSSVLLKKLKDIAGV